MEVRFDNTAFTYDNRIDKIYFRCFDNNENTAEVWFSGFLDKINSYSKPKTFGSKDYFKVLILNFEFFNLSGVFEFDFYELKKFQNLLSNFNDEFKKLGYDINFIFEGDLGLEEFKVGISKNVKFNRLFKLKIRNKNDSFIPINFDVDEEFFRNLNLRDKKITFDGDFAIGFEKPISINKIPIVFDFKKGQITTFNENFDNFYNFFKNSVTNFEDEKKYNLELNDLKFVVSNCEQYQKFVELFSPEYVKILDISEKCEKIIIKNFGQKLSKSKNNDSTFEINDEFFRAFDEIIFDTNAVPFSFFTFDSYVFDSVGKKIITFRNLKDIHNLGIKNPQAFEINVENCKLGYLEIWFDDYLKENFELKIKNTNFYGNFVVPSFAIDKIKGENNNAELVFIKMNVNSLVEINGIEKYIFGETGIYIDYLEKFKGDKIIATLFFIFNSIENKKSLYEKLKDIVEKQMGFDSGFRISVSGFDNDEDEYKFENLYSIFDELFVIKGKKELKNVFNFLNIKNFLNG